MTAFSRILFFIILFAIAGKERNILCYNTSEYHDQVNPQLSGNNINKKNDLSDHSVNNDHGILDKDDYDSSENNCTGLSVNFPDPHLLFLLDHLSSEISPVSLNNLREKRISTAHVTPRYILHHNLRIPS